MRLSRRTRLEAWRCSQPSADMSGCGGGGGDDSTSRAIRPTPSSPLFHEPQNPIGSAGDQRVRRRSNVIDLLYAGLITYKEDGSQELEVAESITLTTTRPGRSSHMTEVSDGTAVTAKSFVDSWTTAPSLAAERADASYFYYPIEARPTRAPSTRTPRRSRV